MNRSTMSSEVARMRTADSGELPGAPGSGMFTCAPAMPAAANKAQAIRAVRNVFMRTPKVASNKSQARNARQSGQGSRKRGTVAGSDPQQNLREISAFGPSGHAD